MKKPKIGLYPSHSPMKCHTGGGSPEGYSLTEHGISCEILSYIEKEKKQGGALQNVEIVKPSLDWDSADWFNLMSRCKCSENNQTCNAYNYYLRELTLHARTHFDIAIQFHFDKRPSQKGGAYGFIRRRSSTANSFAHAFLSNWGDRPQNGKIIRLPKTGYNTPYFIRKGHNGTIIELGNIYNQDDVYDFFETNSGIKKTGDCLIKTLENLKWV